MNRYTPMLQKGKQLILFGLIFLASLRLDAQEYSDILTQKLQFHIENANPDSIIEQLVNSFDLYFSFNPSTLPNQKFTIEADSIPLKDILRQFLPENKYNIESLATQIIISYREEVPILISGTIFDADDNEPLPYASISIRGESIGTITNREGAFHLRIPARFKEKKVMIGSLGFDELILPPDSLHEKMEIKLNPVTFKLREIKVSPITAREIMQLFRDNIESNYPKSPQLMTTFYREVMTQDDVYIGVWEAVMEMLKSSYKNPINDRVRFLKGRKSDFNHDFKQVGMKIQGGPWYITKLDVVKEMESFLNPEFENLYRYRFENPIVHHGRVTWVIRFARQEKVNFPCFEGKFYIDAETFGLVRAEYSMDRHSLKLTGRSFIKKEPHGYRTSPSKASYLVTYRLLNGKWHFYTAQTDVRFKIKHKKQNFKSEFRSIADILVTQQYTFPRKARFGSEGIFHSSDIFTEIKQDYDPLFWGNYNVIEPNEALSKALRISTENQQ